MNIWKTPFIKIDGGGDDTGKEEEKSNEHGAGLDKTTTNNQSKPELGS